MTFKKFTSLLVIAILSTTMLTGCGGPKKPATPPPAPAALAVPRPDTVPLREAIEQTAQTIATRLPRNSRVAIVSFPSENANLSEHIMEELASALSGRNIEVSDRQILQYVFREVNLPSGVLNETDARTVAGYLAVDAVITGHLMDLGGIHGFGITVLQLAPPPGTTGTLSHNIPSENIRSLIQSLQGAPTPRIEGYGVSETQNPRTAGKFLDRGILFASRNNHQRAIQDFTSAIDMKSNMSEAFTLRGTSKLRVGNVGEAIEDFDRAVAINPSNPVMFYNRGLIHLQLGNSGAALEDFNRAIQLNPNFFVAYLARGALHRERNNFDAAITDYNRASQIDPDNSRLYHDRALAFRGRNELDRAIADFDRAILINMSYTSAFLNRGITLAQRGFYDRAINDFNRAIQLDRTDPNIFFNRALAFLNRGDQDRAIADFQVVMRLDPSNAEARRRLESLGVSATPAASIGDEGIDFEAD